MNHKYLRAFFSLIALAVLVVAPGCVSQRPSRNGVFNENQYVRKDFLIRGAADGSTDPGWILKATVTQVSTPNPLGDLVGIFPGSENGGQLVRFKVTQDKLQMINLRELSSVASTTRMPEVVNAWPITNVDLKYRVNLDGETTNFYEENQELDWQVRQWVKINFAKNDMSDAAPLGVYTSELLGLCTDLQNASATLADGSFLVDTANGYITWTVTVAVPLVLTDPNCITAFGENINTAALLGRQNVTFNLMYSLVRAKDTTAKDAYQPFQVAEKDPIRHKYGPIETVSINRNPNPTPGDLSALNIQKSGLLGARELITRFDPTKPIVWYFAEGFPKYYKQFFTGPGLLQDQTNKLLEDVGATARVSFKDFDEDLAPGEPPRQYGDVRYNFFRWISDTDSGGGFAGVTQFVVDPRTGESISSSISFNDFAIQDLYVQRVDAYLQMIGAFNATSAGDANGMVGVNASGEWTDPGACMSGDTMKIVPDTAISNHNGNSSLYQKMQLYLQKPAAMYGPLGPQDFIQSHTTAAADGTPAPDADFYRAFYALAPYSVFADPAMNPFVLPEGGAGTLGPSQLWEMVKKETQFQQLAAQIDQGQVPFEDVTGPSGLQNALSFLNNFRDLTLAHKNYKYSKLFVRPRMHLDAPDAFSFEQVMAKNSRHCVDGKWETKEQWVQNMLDAYWTQVIWHEFGHSLGLEHNFMASVDGQNFPKYVDGSGNTQTALYASSVMEYNSAPDRIFWHAGWAPYDVAAIGWIYGNSGRNDTTCDPNDSKPNHGCAMDSAGKAITSCLANTSGDTAKAPFVCIGDSISGQATPTGPWADKFGFGKWQWDPAKGDFALQQGADATVENQFLYCNEHHLLYTPLCRQGDLGVTPSEIIANEIDSYEWNYQWRNFRNYRKIWDDSAYANAPAGIITDMRRFLSMWAFDWSTSELADSLRRIGVTNPHPDMTSDVAYYTSLTNKFNADISAANQLIAAFHESVVQQSAGERPFRTVYDNFYGDVTQQGIILDKLFAIQGWTGLWPTTNYDPNQAGSYISSWNTVGDSSYGYVAQSAAVSMIGGQYDIFPYAVPLAVAQFAQDTHSPSFTGSPSVRNWVGGWTFYRLQDFLDYFRDLAVQNNAEDPIGSDCTAFNTCQYDPRQISDTHNEFIGPDKRIWIWAYIPDRNQWVAAQKEFNTASYVIIRAYTDDVVNQIDDGNFPGNAFNLELPMKYFLDSFNAFN